MKFSRVPLALATFGAGLQSILYAKLPPELAPIPAWVPGQPALAMIGGLALAASGCCLVVPAAERIGALAMMALSLVCLVFLQVPQLVANLHNGGAWTTAFEILAIGAVFAVVAGYRRAGQMIYGLSLPVFGILHVVYAAYVVSVIPAWLPGATFWAYFTAAAHAAAGLSLVTAIQARLAAILLTVMFGSWALILHLPRVLASGGSRAELTSLFVAMAFCGGAWSIAEGLSASSNYGVPSRRTESIEIDPPSIPLTGKVGVSSGHPAPSTYNSGK